MFLLTWTHLYKPAEVDMHKKHIEIYVGFKREAGTDDSKNSNRVSGN